MGLPALIIGLGMTVALTACGGSDAKESTPTQARAGDDTATASTAAPTSAAPTNTAPAALPRPVTGLFEEPRAAGTVTQLVAPAPSGPTFPFAPVVRGNMVLFDIAAKKATDFGPGTLPSFSPDGTKLAWVSATGNDPSRGDIKVMDFADGVAKTVGEGRGARFLDLTHVTYFLGGSNDKVSLDLATGAIVTVDGRADDVRYFERVDAARSTTPDGFRITRSDDPKGTALPRGGATSSIIRVTETRSSATVLQFQAFAAIPAGRGFIAVATAVRGETVNIFLVEIATGKAEFIATTRFSAPNFPFVADDARVVWADSFCGVQAARLFIFERQAARRLLEVDTRGDGYWPTLMPSGQIGLGEFGPKVIVDPATFATIVRLPDVAGDIQWSPDYRFAASGFTGGHGGLC